MAFGQPYVLDESGQILGNALGNAGETIANAILRNKDLARQNRLFEIQNPGYHLLQRGQQAPPDDETLDVQGAPQIQSTPTAFQQSINSALTQGQRPQAPPPPASVTRASQPLVRGNGYYYDPNEAMRILMPRMQMSGLGEYFKSLYGAAGKAQGDPSEVNLRNSTIGLNNTRAALAAHQNQAPVLGEAGYAPAKATEAGAVANAQIPARNAETDYRIKGETAMQKELIPLRAAAEAQQFNLHLGVSPLNEQESDATTQLPMIARGLQILRSTKIPDAREMAASGGHWFKNFLNTPEGRRWQQAASQVALSGAVAQEGNRGSQPERVEFYRNNFVPVAGDDDKTAMQKMASLNNLLRAIKVKSGRGFSRLPDDVQSQINGVIGTGMGSGSTAGAGLGGNPYLRGGGQ